MRRLIAVVLGLAVPGNAQTAPGLPFTSAMIDPAMFRDGEVQRTGTRFGAWLLTCDAIHRLGRKYCSLRSAPAVVGSTAIDLTVSTGDDGRPAALLRLPFGLALSSGVTIGVEVSGQTHTRQVPIALCDPNGCVAVWTMDGAELAALRHGQPMRVGMTGWTPGRADHVMPPPIEIGISGRGFPEALAASVR